MAEVINNIPLILSIAWVAIILTEWYINLCIKSGVKIRKPFGCEKCLGFWIGLGLFYFQGENNFVIFALLTSLVAVLTNKLVRL